MPLSLQVDPGGEQYLAYAKRKLQALKVAAGKAHTHLVSRAIQVTDGAKIFLNAVHLGHGVWRDRIRIAVSSAFGLTQFADNWPAATVIVGALINQAGKVLKPSRTKFTLNIAHYPAIQALYKSDGVIGSETSAVSADGASVHDISTAPAIPISAGLWGDDSGMFHMVLDGPSGISSPLSTVESWTVYDPATDAWSDQATASVTDGFRLASTGVSAEDLSFFPALTHTLTLASPFPGGLGGDIYVTTGGSYPARSSAVPVTGEAPNPYTVADRSYVTSATFSPVAAHYTGPYPTASPAVAYATYLTLEGEDRIWVFETDPVTRVRSDAHEFTYSWKRIIQVSYVVSTGQVYFNPPGRDILTTSSNLLWAMDGGQSALFLGPVLSTGAPAPAPSVVGGLGALITFSGASGGVGYARAYTTWDAATVTPGLGTLYTDSAGVSHNMDAIDGGQGVPTVEAVIEGTVVLNETGAAARASSADAVVELSFPIMPVPDTGVLGFMYQFNSPDGDGNPVTIRGAVWDGTTLTSTPAEWPTDGVVSYSPQFCLAPHGEDRSWWVGWNRSYVDYYEDGVFATRATLDVHELPSSTSHDSARVLYVVRLDDEFSSLQVGTTEEITAARDSTSGVWSTSTIDLVVQPTWTPPYPDGSSELLKQPDNVVAPLSSYAPSTRRLIAV